MKQVATVYLQCLENKMTEWVEKKELLVGYLLP